MKHHADKIEYSAQGETVCGLDSFSYGYSHRRLACLLNEGKIKSAEVCQKCFRYSKNEAFQLAVLAAQKRERKGAENEQ